MVTKATDIADEFNAFFCPTPDHLLNSIQQSTLSQTAYSFYLYPTSSVEVSDAIASLQTTGPDFDYLQPPKIKLI